MRDSGEKKVCEELTLRRARCENKGMKTTHPTPRKTITASLVTAIIVAAGFATGALIGYPIDETILEPFFGKDKALYAALLMLAAITWVFWTRQQRTQAWAPRVIAWSFPIVIGMSIAVAVVAGPPDNSDTIAEQVRDFGIASAKVWAVALVALAGVHRRWFGRWQRNHQAELARQAAKVAAADAKVLEAQIEAVIKRREAAASGRQSIEIRREVASAVAAHRGSSTPGWIILGIALFLARRSGR